MLNENLQQAEKLYFKNNKIGEVYKNAILNITGGDVFTKLVADFVFHMSSFGNYDASDLKMAQNFYKYLKAYNKSVFPIPGNLLDYGIKNERDKHVIDL